MTWPSEGIVSSLIGAVATVLAAALAVVLPVWIAKKRKKDRTPAPARVELPKQATPAAKPPAPARASITAITLTEIIENVERVPPFQQDDVHKHFVGMRVCWPATLKGISRLSDTLQVTVKFTERDTLGFCSAAHGDVHGLVHAPEGTLLEVEGSLKEVSKYEARLTDCVIKPSGLNDGPYGVLLRQSPREAMFAAWKDVEATALMLLDSKVTRTSSAPIPAGVVAKTLQLYGLLTTGQNDTLLKLSAIHAQVVAKPKADLEAKSAPGYCTIATELIRELRAK